MKKVLSLFFIAVLIAHVFLTGTPQLNKKPDISLSLLLAMADDGNGENDPPDPPDDPLPLWLCPDSTIFYLHPIN